MISIYALLDPETMQCRYVGKSKHGCDARLKGHLSDARRRSDVPRFRWIRALAEKGLVPKVKELALVPEDSWQEAEKFWIAKMKGMGCQLLNRTAGGEGLHDFKHSQETRRKMSESAREAAKDPSVFERRSNALKKAFASGEIRRSISERMKKFYSSEDERAKQSVRSRIAASTPEARARSSRIHKGKVTPEGVRKKISEARKGSVASEETRNKMSLVRTGTKRSPETRERMRVAARLRYERLRMSAA